VRAPTPREPPSDRLGCRRAVGGRREGEPGPPA